MQGEISSPAAKKVIETLVHVLGHSLSIHDDVLTLRTLQ